MVNKKKIDPLITIMVVSCCLAVVGWIGMIRSGSLLIQEYTKSHEQTNKELVQQIVDRTCPGIHVKDEDVAFVIDKRVIVQIDCQDNKNTLSGEN